MTSLHNVWKIVYTARDTLQNNQFDGAFREICEVSTAAQFAYVWPRLLRVSQLAPQTSIYFVRDLYGDLPAWERYPNGGCYHYKKQFRRDGAIQIVDRIWEKLVFAVLSEQLQEPIVSAIQAIARHDNAEFVVWHHQPITKRVYSRVQLKLGPIFETRVAEIAYQTNTDAILYKSKLLKQDQESKDKRQQRPQQPREQQREERKDAPQRKKDRPQMREIRVEDLEPKTAEQAPKYVDEIVFEIIDTRKGAKNGRPDAKKLEFRDESY